jgi:hypothetical protein
VSERTYGFESRRAHYLYKAPVCKQVEGKSNSDKGTTRCKLLALYASFVILLVYLPL